MDAATLLSPASRDEQLAADIARLLALAGTDELPDEEDDLEASPAALTERKADRNAPSVATTTPGGSRPPVPTPSTAVLTPAAPEIASSVTASSSSKSRADGGAAEPPSLLTLVGATTALAALLTLSSLLLTPTLEAYEYRPPPDASGYGSLQRMRPGSAQYAAAEGALSALPLEGESGSAAAAATGAAAAAAAAPAAAAAAVC